MSQEQLRILRNVLNCSKKEGEREREKETARDRETERDRERDRERETCTDYRKNVGGGNFGQKKDF